MGGSSVQKSAKHIKSSIFINPSLIRNTFLSFLPPMIFLLLLYATSFYNFLLFLRLVELSTILLSFTISIFTWNTRLYLDNNYLLFIGISFLALLMIDTVNMFVYSRFNIFPNETTSIAAQLEISFRLVHSISFLLALYFLPRHLSIHIVIIGYTICLCLLFASIFYWHNFPIIYIEGSGVTIYKYLGEYFTSLILFIAASGLILHASHFKPEVLIFLLLSILVIAVGEVILTNRNYRPDNTIQYIIKLFSFSLVYKAIVKTGLQQPLSVLMMNLKNSQEEQWQYSLKLAEQNEELEAFGHTVAHDLKNSVSGIILSTKAISDTASDECTKKSFLIDITRTANEMNDIIENLMILSGLYKTKLDLEELDMKEIIAGVFQRLRAMIDEYKAEIITPQDWPVAIGYSPWIKEVWTNYLSNAIQYGGNPPCIEIGVTSKSDGMLHFWIRDNGDGIPVDEQYKLFKPFSKIQSHKDVGHGLGLSIVYRIIVKLGGQVGVKSQTSQGSTFFFTLPAKKD